MTKSQFPWHIKNSLYISEKKRILQDKNNNAYEKNHTNVARTFSAVIITELCSYFYIFYFFFFVNTTQTDQVNEPNLIPHLMAIKNDTKLMWDCDKLNAIIKGLSTW